MSQSFEPSTISFALFTPTLGAGGIQRVYINLGKALAAKGYNVVYIVSRAEGAFVEEVVASQMKLVDLNVSNLRYALSALKTYLKTNKVDYILSGPPYATFLSIIAVRLGRTSTRVLAAIHAYIDEEARNEGILGKMMPRLIRLFYPKSYKMLAVTRDIKRYMAEQFRLNPGNIEVIYNLVIADDFYDKANEVSEYKLPDNNPYIMAIGRLVKVKDYGTLIKAFKNVADAHNDTTLVIVGEGQESDNLTSLAAQYGIADKVIFTGMMNNPYPLLKKAALLVSSSTSESLGSTLVEALALQVPVVATATEGAKDVLMDGKYGKLVPIGDSDQLGAAIKQQLEEGAVFNNERWKDFSSEGIIEQYRNIFTAG